MTHYLKNRYMLPIGLFMLLLLDGSLSLAFQQFFSKPPMMISARLLLMGLILTVFILPEEKWLIYFSMGLGLIFDFYYTGIVGVYLFILPIIVYLVEISRRYLPDSPLFIGLVYIVSITGLESAIYVINIFLSLTSVNLVDFVSFELGPTLLINLLLFVILYFPFSRLLLKLKVY